MNPWQLAKTSESSHQIALFCFAAKAQKVGFKAAMMREAYGQSGTFIDQGKPIPELAFLHHIPNGGKRGDTARSAAIAGGLLKAEGVKAGVLDIFWPLVRSPFYCGLYIEMKAAKGKLSDEQFEFGEFVKSQGYCPIVCYSWLEAAEKLECYYNLGHTLGAG